MAHDSIQDENIYEYILPKKHSRSRSRNKSPEIKIKKDFTK